MFVAIVVYVSIVLVGLSGAVTYGPMSFVIETAAGVAVAFAGWCAVETARSIVGHLDSRRGERVATVPYRVKYVPEPGDDGPPRAVR